MFEFESMLGTGQINSDRVNQVELVTNQEDMGSSLFRIIGFVFRFGFNSGMYHFEFC